MTISAGLYFGVALAVIILLLTLPTRGSRKWQQEHRARRAQRRASARRLRRLP